MMLTRKGCSCGLTGMTPLSEPLVPLVPSDIARFHSN
jgi:hypothetical protein